MYNISRHERVRPLFQNCVVLRFICLVDDGNAVGVATSNGEDDLRRRKKVYRGNLCYRARFRRWCTSGGVDDGTVGAGQNTQSFL
jgi:hypothetical protein